MALFDTLVQKYRNERTRKVLNALSDRQLNDIGLSRGDVVDQRGLYMGEKLVGLRGII